MGQTLSELRMAVSTSEQQLTQRLDVKEKVLMRMAKEVDDIKATLAQLPRAMIGQAGAAAGVSPGSGARAPTADVSRGGGGGGGAGGGGGGGGSGPGRGGGGGKAAAQQTHRYSMFTD